MICGRVWWASYGQSWLSGGTFLLVNAVMAGVAVPLWAQDWMLDPTGRKPPSFLPSLPTYMLTYLPGYFATFLSTHPYLAQDIEVCLQYLPRPHVWGYYFLFRQHRVVIQVPFSVTRAWEHVEKGLAVWQMFEWWVWILWFTFFFSLSPASHFCWCVYHGYAWPKGHTYVYTYISIHGVFLLASVFSSLVPFYLCLQ